MRNGNQYVLVKPYTTEYITERSTTALADFTDEELCDILAKNEEFKEDMKKLAPVTMEFIEQMNKSALASCTDEELWHELGRRGWEGNLTRRQTVSLGQQQ